MVLLPAYHGRPPPGRATGASLPAAHQRPVILYFTPPHRQLSRTTGNAHLRSYRTAIALILKERSYRPKQWKYCIIGDFGLAREKFSKAETCANGRDQQHAIDLCAASQ